MQQNGEQYWLLKRRQSEPQKDPFILVTICLAAMPEMNPILPHGDLQ
jgi:hypothetical protein